MVVQLSLPEEVVPETPERNVQWTRETNLEQPMRIQNIRSIHKENITIIQIVEISCMNGHH